MILKIQLAFLAMLMIAPIVRAQSTERGTINSDKPREVHSLNFEAGTTILLMTEVTDGDLDTVLSLFDNANNLLEENDDYNPSTYNSALVYTIEESGTYNIRVEAYEGETEGDYTLNVTIGDKSLYEYLASISRLELSGTPLTFDTEHFRIHYTLEGADDTTQAYVEMLGKVMEEVWDIQINQMGWPAPPSDAEYDSDPRYDVYIASLKKDLDVTLGFTQSEELVEDNPNSRLVEEYASTSYLTVENDFMETLQDDQRADALTLLRATAAHEFHHAIQMGYDYNELHNWYGEATSSWMETVTFKDAQDATIYVEYNYTYPEICFGTVDDPGEGSLQYGDWMFIQSIVDAHGMEIVRELWGNIAVYEEFEPLEITLETHNDTVPAALTRYRIQNLVRDYTLAPEFGATVWLEDIIRSDGEWTHTGDGVQELGANYFQFKLPAGVYQIKLSEKTETLELWAVGIRDQVAEAFVLDGALDTRSYDYVYLMVFNQNYDDDVSDCTYYTYSLLVDALDASEVMNTPAFTFDATYFEPLVLDE